MLNLFDKKTKNTSRDISKLNFFSDTAKDTGLTSNTNINGETRHYPPATQEWFNSIYLYNKNHIKPLPVVDNTVNNILKSYFRYS